MKKKKKQKETLLIIFLVILALAIGIVAGYLVQNSEESVSGAKTQNKSEHTENISQENSETEYMVIETEYGDLLYPEQWSEYLKTEQNMEKDSLQVSFSAQLEDKNYPMFQVTIGDSEDTESIMRAITALKKHQFSACIDIVKGNMHGYVFAKESELEEVREHLKLSEGCALGIKKADRHTGENVKHLLK